MILIVSKDREFSGALAEQVKRELKTDCQTVESAADAKPLLAAASLAITTQANGAWPVPVIHVEKPVRLRKLLAEIEAALQKPAAGESQMLSKDYRFSLRDKRLSGKGKTVDLTDKEAQLLSLLLEVGKEGIGKEALLKSIWGFENELNTHTLETHIYRLRAKLKDLSGAEMIAAADGGYRLEL